MFDMTKTKTKEKLQVKFLQFLSKHKGLFTLPEFKFLIDMCLGILKTHAVINNKIAIGLLEAISPKNVCKRFTRHLNKADLGVKIQ